MGDGVTGCWFPRAKFLIGSQQLDWVIDGFTAVLLGENSNVLNSLGAQVVTDIDLDEFDGTGYGRQPIQNTSILEDVGERIRFVGDNVVFGPLGSGSSRARWSLIVKNGANDTVRIPIFVVGRALGPIDPNGGSVELPIEAIW